MIPKILHYCWFGNQEKPKTVKDCIESWKKYLSDYEIKEWNENNSPMDSEYIQNALKNKKYANMSNLIRLYALIKEGGIYLDTDMEVLRSFDPLLDDDCFVGFQEKKESIECVNNAVIGSIPKNDFIKSVYERILKEFDGTERANLSSPRITTTILSEMGLKQYDMQKIKNVKIYPIEYFYPYPWNGVFTKECVKENTYCIHHWTNLWE